LGNRSALEWVLDQYKEKTPKDPTIREKFNLSFRRLQRARDGIIKQSVPRQCGNYGIDCSNKKFG
jgi:hypothetical protein